jgi:DNA repair protein RadC
MEIGNEEGLMWEGDDVTGDIEKFLNDIEKRDKKKRMLAARGFDEVNGLIPAGKKSIVVRQKGGFEEYKGKNKKIHEGHRSRTRRLMLSEKFDDIPDHLILEYLLYHFVPMKDTNKLAHFLLEIFGGSISNLFNADYLRLLAIKDIPQNFAHFVACYNKIGRRINEDAIKEKMIINSVDAAVEFANTFLINLPVEYVYIVCLNSRSKLIKKELISKGTISEAFVDMKEVMNRLLSLNAKNFILCHNHPSGDTYPSSHDDNLTRQMLGAFSRFDIVLLDHIIIGADDYYSYRTDGRLELLLEEELKRDSEAYKKASERIKHKW